MVCAFSESAISRPLSFTEYDEPIRGAVKKYWPDFPDWLYWKAQLYQESRFDPEATSPVGARGLAQFMPATWAQMQRELQLGDVPASHARFAIDAGAYYMVKLRRGWSSPRPAMDRHWLAEASYNAGTGNLIKAQRLCGMKALYVEISPCLPMVTGKQAQETLTYVERIKLWRSQLEMHSRL